MYRNTNRKKVRGWRRRVRAVERWRETSSLLDLDALLRYEVRYVKISIDPWNRLTKRNPPAWYRRIVLAALIDIHARWHAQLTSLGLPFLLRLWLMQPRFHSSQVVAAIGSKMDYYARLFLQFPDDDPASIDQYRVPGIPLDDFAWVAGINFEPVAEEDLGSSSAEIARYAADAFHVDTCDGDTFYLIDRGTVWVGERIVRSEGRSSTPVGGEPNPPADGEPIARIGGEVHSPHGIPPLLSR